MIRLPTFYFEIIFEVLGIVKNKNPLDIKKIVGIRKVHSQLVSSINPMKLDPKTAPRRPEIDIRLKVIALQRFLEINISLTL